MTENTTCIKDILEFINDNVKVVIDRDNKFHLETTNLYKIVENLSEKRI